MAEPVLMAASHLFITMQFFADLEGAKISKSECRWLSKTNWKSLNTIKFGRTVAI